MSKIELIEGSCVDQRVDAIVNAANVNMNHIAGVAGAIRHRGGSMIDVACSKYKLPIKVGEAIITPAYNITNAKVVIHAVGPDFNYEPDSEDKLTDAYYNSLILLKDYGYHIIAFPLISSGIFGGSKPNPVRLSTNKCIEGYNRFIKDYPDYDIDVKLCAFSHSEYLEAKKEFE